MTTRTALMAIVLTTGTITSQVVAAEPRAATPVNWPGEWVTSNDYPRDALRARAEGITGFKVTIDEAGAPIACDVTSTSGSVLLDERTCQLVLARARFTAARDASGQLAKGTYTNRVRWILPRARTFPDAAAMSYSFVVETDGSISDCKIIRAEGAAAATAIPSKLCDGMPMIPYRNGRGEARRKRIVISTSVDIQDVAP